MEHNSAPGTNTGQQSATSASLLPYEWRAASGQPQYVMIWLHGLGADGFDFVPIADAMPETTSRDVAYCFPHAPRRAVTINNGMVMRAWYDIMGFDLRRDQDRNGIQQSIQQVEQLRDYFNRQGIPYNRQIVAGFSQGGVIALRCALASKHPPLAVLGLSCYLADAESIASWSPPAAREVPVFMGHGSQDTVVPMVLGQRAKATLLGAGFQVQWHEYPIPHSVSPDEIGHIDQWVAQHLTQAASVAE